MTRPTQMPLPLAHVPAQGIDAFLVSESNRAAWLAVTAEVPPRRFAVSGPAGAGKSHLAAIWAARHGAISIPASALTEQRQGQLLGAPAVVIEDIDRLVDLPGPAQRQVETLIFHLFNLAVAEDSALLVTARAAPGRWSILTPDLASRLSAMAHMPIAAPDDTLLSSILLKLFTDRQLHAGPDVIEFVMRRMERSFAAAEMLVETLDKLALARRRPVTRNLARELFPDEVNEMSDQGES